MISLCSTHNAQAHFKVPALLTHGFVYLAQVQPTERTEWSSVALTTGRQKLLCVKLFSCGKRLLFFGTAVAVCAFP